MAHDSEQKIKLLILYDILCRLTDENHALNADELIEKLAEYSIKASRRVIPADIALLNQYGYEVLSYKKKYYYYYVVNRHFDAAEISMLADVVKASKLSAGQKTSLIGKLSKMVGDHQAEKSLSKHIINCDTPKRTNSHIIYSIDAIDRAISERKKVSFLYFTLDAKKNKVYRKEGKRYEWYRIMRPPFLSKCKKRCHDYSEKKKGTIFKNVSWEVNMAVSHRGAISFGMVHIPVGLYTATQDNDIHFNQLCKEDGSRVKYKKVCASCGKEISNSDIVKGFEYEPNKYVTMTDEDFEKAKSEKDRTIQILHFTDLQNVRPIYFDKTYHAVPEQGGDKAYELLRRAMLDENKIAIAKTVLGTKEKLLALIPTSHGLLVETLFFADEIKDAPKEPASVEVVDAELQMAKTLIGAMVKPFEPEQFKDEYREKLWEIINSKIQGKEFVVPDEHVEFSVINLMDALKQSLEQAGSLVK